METIGQRWRETNKWLDSQTCTGTCYKPRNVLQWLAESLETGKETCWNLSGKFPSSSEASCVYFSLSKKTLSNWHLFYWKWCLNRIKRRQCLWVTIFQVTATLFQNNFQTVVFVMDFFFIMCGNSSSLLYFYCVEKQLNKTTMVGILSQIQCTNEC